MRLSAIRSEMNFIETNLSITERYKYDKEQLFDKENEFKNNKTLLDKKLEIEKLTIQELAHQTYTSPATIIRLAKKLGYEGYEAFKKRFHRRTKIYINTF